VAFKDKKVSIEVVAPVSPHPTLSQWEREIRTSLLKIKESLQGTEFDR